MSRIGWDLFSGIGGIKCGMQLAGITSVLGVEYDPHDPKLSEFFVSVHKMNGWHGTRLQTVQEFRDWGFPGLPIEADIAHISPVCADYSAAKNNNGKKVNENMEMAIASMDAIEFGKPLNFTLEQVPNYRTSPEFYHIRDRAIALGYIFRSTVINVGAPFGQSRRRLIAVASRVGNWEAPPRPLDAKWYTTIEDLIDAFLPVAPTQRQIDSVAKWYAAHPEIAALPPSKQYPLYVERVTSGMQPKTRGHFEITPTLTKSKFRDGNTSGRSLVTNLYMPDRRGAEKWLNLSMEAYARLQGFPDTFRYPNVPYMVGAGFGYSVPPIWYASLLATMPG